ncbi:hypothetical protein F4819DRAFT_435554 [Hypoxylon fuscum]|nr:hypothetical protein F4819DRAFT_435554 [Hypoxylon fuscum]
MAERETASGETLSRPAAVVASTVPPAPIGNTPSDPSSQKEKENVTIEIPPASFADDEVFTSALVDLIIAAYDEAEADIFKPGYTRTSAQDVAALVRAGKLVVASRLTTSSDAESALASGRVPVGCISINKLSENRAELGMFAVGMTQRGTGLGRDLMAFAERWVLDNLGGPGVAFSQLDLLVPTHFEHVFKARLGAWYARLGYQVVGRRDFALDYPRLAPLLAGPTEYRVYEKKLV